MNKKIFIVEDDEDIASILRELLESEGYSVDVAHEGSEALAKLRADATLPAFIILDLMMPGMNGFEFREQQERDPRLAPIPVVVMTADGNIVEKKLRLGTLVFIRKPPDIDAILATAKRFCV